MTNGSAPSLATTRCRRNQGRREIGRQIIGSEQSPLLDGLVTFCESEGAGADFIDYGLSVLERRVIVERIPAATAADLSDHYGELGIEGSLAGYKGHRRFYDEGSTVGLAELERCATDEER